MASYLFGHLDGIAEEERPGIAAELVGADAASASAITELVPQMRALWDRRGKWESYDGLMALGQTAFRLIHACGVHVTPQANGSAYINVPSLPTRCLPARRKLISTACDDGRQLAEER